MKHWKSICWLSLLAHITSSATPFPFIGFRSQSNNGMRPLCQRRTPFGDFETAPTMLGVTVMYQQSRKPHDIGHYILGQPCSIAIQGSRFNNGDRDPNAWLADYFGLSTDFASTISYKPRIKNTIAELSGWWASHETGLFIDFQVPLVHTTAFIHACEHVEHPGTLSYGNGYFTENLIGSENLVQTAQQFFEQEATPNLGSGTIFQPLTSSRIAFDNTSCGHDNKDTRLSDMIVRVGRDFIFHHSSCFTPYMRLSIPTGNKPKGIWLLEASIGNGGHWGLGGGFNAQWSIWHHDTCDYMAYLFIDTYAQHLFATKQKKSFDLLHKPNSRYMLAQKLTTQRQDPSLSGASDAGIEFANEYAPISNLTYGCVNVSTPIEGEITAWVIGHFNALEASIGYNFWAVSHEKISYKNPPPLVTSLWALKGDAQVIGFRSTDNAAVRLAAVQDEAMITHGTNNFPNGIDGVAPEQNPGISHPVAATTGAGVVVTALPFGVLGQTNSSNPADVLTLCEIDFESNRGISNSLFGYIAYAPHAHHCTITPRVELGGQIEFGRSSDVKSTCSLSTWGIWTTLAVGF